MDYAVSYRIEQDHSLCRGSGEGYRYYIYEGDRLIARYRHDHKGDEHSILFVEGLREVRLMGRVGDFIEGGGPEPLRLSDAAVEYLKGNANRMPTVADR